MSGERWAKAKEVFADAADLPEDQRAAFLDRACAGDPELREEVEQLLRGDQKASTANLLESGPPLDVLQALTTRIGRYEILETLGEGGMGRIYLAQQTKPVSRRVALKLIKLGMDTEQVLLRFEAERQALAMMEHDNIAKVFDAGTTENGQPYFVMEYVPGMPLKDYCDQHSLDRTERLKLFLRICAGVQHAHQKGVIHRDLKPSNILVTEQEGRPVPKIIDFGIAKATDQRSAGTTQFTLQGQVIGTPEYMSPEQADLDSTDIDTRSDVYSLGVILYELLTGELPTGPEPQKPSARNKELRGDLDWIILKALATDRERRYPTPISLAEDITRHLEDEPVEAGPPSTSYRIQKFMRRHRLQVAAAGAVLLTLLAGIVSTTFFMFEAEAKATDAATHLGNYNLLANVVKLDEAQAVFDDPTALYPAWPDKIEAMSSWITEQAEPLERELPRLQQALRAFRKEAMKPGAADLARWRRQHPRAGELARLKRKLEALSHAHEVREGNARPNVHELQEPLPEDATSLNLQAWPLVASTEEERVWGREAEGLALARRAWKRARLGRDRAQRARVAATLAWALFANGLDKEAIASAKTAVAEAPDATRQRHRNHLEEIRARVAAAQGPKGKLAIAALSTKVQALEAEVSLQRDWRFADKAHQFLHDALARLVERLRTFTHLKTGALARVRERLAWARSVSQRTITGREVSAAWERARLALAKDNIDLHPQLGLIPLGRNPKTGLWEFYHLRSAANPDKIPVHDKSGNIRVDDDTGIVFVLIPGGRFLMGAQNKDPDQPNYDANAKPHELLLHEVELEPYFLARHELTQGQWMRLSGGENPSTSKPGWDRPDDRAAPVTLAHPVEAVSWNHSRELLRQHGLDLPTDAEWECGCRGGQTTAWCTGKDAASLAGHANLRDQTAGHAVSQWGKPESFDDGYIEHAPVGTFKPNGFGLFDVHGNVWEWCRGRKSSSATPYLVCGGNYRSSAINARAALRLSAPPDISPSGFGVRAARRIR